MNLKDRIILLLIPTILVITFVYLATINNQTNLFFNLISVLIGASISICSTLIYNDYVIKQKRKADEIKKENLDKKVLIALKSNLNENVKILNENVQSIQKEMLDVYQIKPFKESKSSFWDMIKLNIPKKLEILKFLID